MKLIRTSSGRSPGVKAEVAPHPIRKTPAELGLAAAGRPIFASDPYHGMMLSSVTGPAGPRTVVVAERPLQAAFPANPSIRIERGARLVDTGVTRTGLFMRPARFL